MDTIWAQEPGFTVSYLERIMNATAADREAAINRFGDEPLPPILSIEGSTAKISITGPLSPTGPSHLARFFGFGGTGYADIIAAVREVKDNPAITKVIFPTNTPGGTVTMLDETRHEIAALAKDKEVIFENHGMIASAGMWLASAPKVKIIATSPTVETGSIGVKMVGYDVTEALKKIGYKKVTILSRNAPNKSAQLDTKKGMAESQRQADALERVFISRVAEGRGVSEQTVIDDFGKGGLLIAQDPDPDSPDALSVGMIDALIDGSLALQAEHEDDYGYYIKTAGPTAFKDFPIVDEKWDADAADKRIRKFFGITDKPNDDYRQAFFWFDSEDAGNFGAYKLPFVDVVDGELKAIAKGVSSADGAMSGARGQRVNIPNADRKRVQSHIDRYQAKWRRQKGGQGSASSTTQESKPMTLKELLADSPGAQSEYDAAIAAARTDGEEAGQKKVNARIEAAKPYLSADSKYPSSIIGLAAKVVAGDVDDSALVAAVAAYDATKESAASAAAEGETDDQGDTAAQQHAQGTTAGEIKTHEDYEATVAAARKSRGLEG